MSATDAPAQIDPLDKIFFGLKNKNADVRLQSAQDLRKYVCPPPMYAKYRTSLNVYQIIGSRCCS